MPSSLITSINTTNIDTLLVATDQTERIVEPPENVQEKTQYCPIYIWMLMVVCRQYHFCWSLFVSVVSLLQFQ